jgi:chromosome segregation ATPase
VKAIWMITFCVAVLGAGSAILGCKKEAPKGSEVSAADKAAAQKSASDLAAAEKAAAHAQAEKAALPPDLVEMQAEITRMTAQIDLTMAKLDTLSAATGDLEKPSESALAAIEALDAEAQVLKKRGEQMRDRGAAYFELWEKQLASISTPEVAEIAAKRKEELATKYADVLTAMQETRAAMDAYWSDMTALRKVIEEDLTPDSQKLLAPQVKAAKDKAMTLKSRIEETFAKLGEVSLIYAKR